MSRKLPEERKGRPYSVTVSLISAFESYEACSNTDEKERSAWTETRGRHAGEGTKGSSWRFVSGGSFLFGHATHLFPQAVQTRSLLPFF